MTQDDIEHEMTQSEALRLSAALKQAIQQTDTEDNVIDVARWFVEDSADELRRLHGEVESLTALLADVRGVEAELDETSDALHRSRAENERLRAALEALCTDELTEDKWDNARATLDEEKS
jgi:hypothetical protein